MIPTTLFLAGAIVGSFVNVVVYRFPRGVGFVRGRSHCINCNKTLKWTDLVPLISFFVLRGRCRYCRKPISFRYPFVETLSGLLFAIAYVMLSQYGVVSVVYAVVLTEIFLIIALIDFDHFIIPDSLLIILLLAGGLYTFVSRYFSLSPTAGHFVMSFENILPAIIASSFFFLIWLLTRGRMMGFGDVKYVAVLGLLFGAVGSFWTVYGAIAIGAVLGIILLAIKKAKATTKVPLGAFLSLTAIVYTLASPWLLDNLILCTYFNIFCNY